MEATPPEMYSESDRAQLALVQTTTYVALVARQISAGASLIPGQATGVASNLSFLVRQLLDQALVTDRICGARLEQVMLFAAFSDLDAATVTQRWESGHLTWQQAWDRHQTHPEDWYPADADPHTGPPRLPPGADHPGVTAADLLRSYPGAVPPLLPALDAYAQSTRRTQDWPRPHTCAGCRRALTVGEYAAARAHHDGRCLTCQRLHQAP